ncbi:hypothetical protein AOL_s00088g17 [Orbilia oligospora ATCC 24927]|uniref:Uncharacterized protein n=2 Tax=Orbilia oligospora TaxID=2813651 RepID=G1XHQ4_ARTOA|nr:hypothetical protein AOL_s00088g17 [Orbilia oligospora ATCC 24927]EGX47302.1 hypothetical protein AOL_s00088g17 [Orbilia oligospora ATCC 24927]KAF3270563.1 hypothetical protein TWF970_010766 [Orbilia oligospora]
MDYYTFLPEYHEPNQNPRYSTTYTDGLPEVDPSLFDYTSSPQSQPPTSVNHHTSTNEATSPNMSTPTIDTKTVYPEVMMSVAAEYPDLFPENAFLRQRRRLEVKWCDIAAELEELGCGKIQDACLQMRSKRNTAWFGISSDESAKRHRRSQNASKTRRIRQNKKVEEQLLQQKTICECLQAAAVGTPDVDQPAPESPESPMHDLPQSAGEEPTDWPVGGCVNQFLFPPSRRLKYQTNLYKLNM